jgi:hypothetical protein
MLARKHITAIVKTLRGVTHSLNEFASAVCTGNGNELSDEQWPDVEDHLSALRQRMTEAGCYQLGTIPTRNQCSNSDEKKACAALRTLVREVPENPWKAKLPDH